MPGCFFMHTCIRGIKSFGLFVSPNGFLFNIEPLIDVGGLMFFFDPGAGP